MAWTIWWGLGVIHDYSITGTAGPCTSRTQPDCITTTVAMVTHKYCGTYRDNTGREKRCYIRTGDETYLVEELYDHVSVGDTVEIRKLKGMLVSISSGGTADQSAVPKYSAIWASLWIMVTVAALVCAILPFKLEDELWAKIAQVTLVMPLVGGFCGMSGTVLTLALAPIFGLLPVMYASWVIATVLAVLICRYFRRDPLAGTR